MQVQIYRLKVAADAILCAAAGVDLIGISRADHLPLTRSAVEALLAAGPLLIPEVS